jgi:hypothetical protein
MPESIKIMNNTFKVKTLIIAAIVAVVAVLLILSMNSHSNYSANYNKPVSVEQLIANPGGYKGGTIKFVGKVFKVEGSDKSYVLQIYSDIKNSSGNVIVYTSEQFKEGDYVEVSGNIGDKFTGDNAFGASLTAPTVNAVSVKSIDADQAIAPTITTKTPNISKVVDNLTISLQKIEYAKDETRIFLHFSNTGSDNFIFYSFNANLVQNKQKIETLTDYNRTTYVSDNDILADTNRDVKLYYSALDAKSPAIFSFQVTNSNDYSSTDVIFNI